MIVDRYFTVDTARPLTPRGMRDMLMTGDRNAHRFHVRLTRDGAPQSVDGNVTGYFLRADGATILLSAEQSGDELSVLLPGGCYDVPGWGMLCIRLTRGSTVLTLLALQLQIMSGQSGTVYDPQELVPSLDEVLERIAEMEAKTAAAASAADRANAAAGGMELQLAEALLPLDQSLAQLSARVDDLAEEGINAASAQAQQVPTADGNGGWAWADPAAPELDPGDVHACVNQYLEDNTIEGLFYPDNLVLWEDAEEEPPYDLDASGLSVISGRLCQTYLVETDEAENDETEEEG